MSFQTHWGAGVCTAVVEVERKWESYIVEGRRRGYGEMPVFCGTDPISGAVDEEAEALFSSLLHRHILHSHPGH